MPLPKDVSILMGNESTMDIREGEERKIYTDSLRGCNSFVIISQCPENLKVATLAHYSDFDIEDGKAQRLKNILKKHLLHGAHHTALLATPGEYHETLHGRRLEVTNRKYADIMMNVAREVFGANLSQKEIPYSMSDKSSITISQGDSLLESTILKSVLGHNNFHSVEIRFNKKSNTYHICGIQEIERCEFLLQKGKDSEDFKELDERLRQGEKRGVAVEFLSNNQIRYGVLGDHAGFLSQASAAAVMRQKVTSAQPQRSPRMSSSETDPLLPDIDRPASPPERRTWVQGAINVARSARSVLCCGR